MLKKITVTLNGEALSDIQHGLMGGDVVSVADISPLDGKGCMNVDHIFGFL